MVIIGSAVISAIFASGMVICGALSLRGTDIGWILSLDPQSGSSAASVCCGVGTTVSGLTSGVSARSNASGVDTKVATDQFNTAYPDGYQPATVVLTQCC